MAETTTDKPSFSKARRWGILFNVSLTVIAVFAFVVMANYLASGYYRRTALGTNQAQLSPQTVKVLQSLTNDVNATIFFNVRGEDVSGQAEVFERVSRLLKEYQNVASHMKVRTIDFKRFPGDAAVFLSKYKLTNLKDKEFVHFESNEQTKMVYANQLSDYNVNEVLSGESKDFRRITFKGEMLFTSAIFAVAHPRPIKVYFLTGHGEHDPENTAHEYGYARFATLLKEENNAEWEKLGLTGTNDVPADCQLLVVADGQTKAQLSQGEIDAIESYLSKGRRMLVLVNNLSPANSGIEKVLAKWGVEIGNNVIVDKENVATANDLLTFQLNPTHPVTKTMLAEQLRVQLVLPRSLGKATNAAKSTDAPKVEFLAATGTNAIATGYIVQNGRTVKDRELVGSFPLIAAVEQGNIKGVSADRGSTRIIVVGDSLCLNNQLLDSAANHYFANFAVNWLLAQPNILLEDLGPRHIMEYRLNLGASEAVKIRWLFLLGIPGTVLVFGCLVWLRRRS